jgi:Holliday junction DNA helicase RuvA
MFAYLKGILADISEDNCVIDVHDIGYNVKISSQTMSVLPGIGEMVKIYTYTNVKEDTFQLFGFLRKDELDLFKILITVNGIGPKGALSLLSAMDADLLRMAIVSQDVKLLSKAPGIGKRTAERLILELKDKLSITATMIDREIKQYQATPVADTANKKEAVDALVALGYGQAESMKAVNQIEGADTMEVGDLLKAALQKIF